MIFVLLLPLVEGLSGKAGNAHPIPPSLPNTTFYRPPDTN